MSTDRYVKISSKLEIAWPSIENIGKLHSWAASTEG